MEKISGIYKIICLESQKIYIGSSINLKKRKNEHLRFLRLGRHPNKKLQNSFNKYGEESFLFEKVLECEPGQLLVYEEQMIEKFDSAKDGFNILEKPTKNLLGFKHSEISKQKMKKSAKNRGRNSGFLEEKQVIQMRQKFFDGERITNLSKEYNMSRGHVRKCVYLESYQDVPCEIEGYSEMLQELKQMFREGKRIRSRGWKHSKSFIEKFTKAVSKPKPPGKRKLTTEQIISIRDRAKKGETYKVLSEEFGVNQNSISRIVRRLCYKDVI